MATEADEGKDFTIPQAIEMAIHAQRNKNLDTAEEIYRRVLAAWPECPDALHFSGLLALQRGKTGEGLSLVARSLAVAPENPGFWNNFGNILKAEKKNGEAADAYRRAIALRADFADAHSNLGFLVEQDGDTDAAAEEYIAALASEPEHPDALFNLGCLLEKRGLADQALPLFDKVIALRPNDPKAYGRRGHILWLQGKRAEATESIAKCAHLSDGDPSAFVILAGIFWDEDRHQECIEAYHEALAINPRHNAANHCLSRVLNMLGRNAEAGEVWRRWIAVDPENPVPRHMLLASEGGSVPERATDDFVLKVFDGFAETFDEKLAKLEYRAPQLVAAAFAAAHGEPRAALGILDAGCGTGLCAPLLRPFARRLDGVDLSTAMLEKAKIRGGYDHLYCAELTAFLGAFTMEYEAIVSADTLCYFGDLDAVTRAAAGALRPGGTLIFTVEKSAAPAPAGFVLDHTGRYTHSEEYIRSVLARAGLQALAIEGVVLRSEYFQPVYGLVVTARKSQG